MTQQFKVLNPKHERKATPQCCVKVPNMAENWSEYYIERRKKKADKRGWEVDKCQHDSSHLIAGQYYCPLHAGKVVLKMLEQGELQVAKEKSGA